MPAGPTIAAPSASSSEHAGGVDRYEFKYQKDASGKITGTHS
jgi:hypothetical protein